MTREKYREILDENLLQSAPHPTWRSPSNLTVVERICREEWGKLPKYECAKLVPSDPRRLEAVIAAKGASTKY
jgi:hypothetical protein